LAALGDDRPVDYLRDVKPILEHSCFACHGATKQESGLRLDTGTSIHKGGDSGPAVVAGDPVASLLIQAVTGSTGSRMPPEGEGTPLSDEQIQTLLKWINAGAASPADEQPQIDPRTYWSYQPVVRPEPPEVASADWVRTPIDAFIAARHADVGLTPNREASRETWLRRVSLDLIGLPPTPDELHAFLADSTADAYATVVDDLLARPEYGERWGRHWMDVWRYSDWYGSRAGNEIRYSQRHIWRWRDWIVESLNADKGYDRMLIEMLAGDELAPTDPDTLRATGFIGRNWYKFDRNVWMFDAVEHTAQAFLGLTLRCARCHDHKYDPISQQDYYRFRAFFEPHDVRTDGRWPTCRPRKMPHSVRS
jgi:cytochrome c5